MNIRRNAFSVLALLVVAASAYAQNATMKDCPMHQEHANQSSHQAVVEQHGDKGMGFSHAKTAHHFRMTASGGAIEVTATDAADQSDIAAIRGHLSHIAILFGNGDFSVPMFVHDGVPPGVTTMQLLKGKISYKYADIPAGGVVTIEASDPVARAAVHDFLRFQITEHQTGDSLIVASAGD